MHVEIRGQSQFILLALSTLFLQMGSFTILEDLTVPGLSLAKGFPCLCSPSAEIQGVSLYLAFWVLGIRLKS